MYKLDICRRAHGKTLFQTNINIVFGSFVDHQILPLSVYNLGVRKLFIK